MRVENTSRISKNYHQVVLFLLKGNRNSHHNSSAECFSLQSLWSHRVTEWVLTVLPSIPLLLPAVCALHLTQPNLCFTPHPTSYLQPAVKRSPGLPCPQCTSGGSSRSLPVLSPLQKTKWTIISRFSHKTVDGHPTTQAHTSKSNTHFLGLCPSRKSCVQ